MLLAPTADSGRLPAGPRTGAGEGHVPGCEIIRSTAEPRLARQLPSVTAWLNLQQSAVVPRARLSSGQATWMRGVGTGRGSPPMPPWSLKPPMVALLSAPHPGIGDSFGFPIFLDSSAFSLGFATITDLTPQVGGAAWGSCRPLSVCLFQLRILGPRT